MMIVTKAGNFRIPNVPELKIMAASEVLTECRMKTINRILPAIENYVEVVLHTNIPVGKRDIVMERLQEYKYIKINVENFPDVLEGIINSSYSFELDEHIFDREINEAIINFIRRD